MKYKKEKTVVIILAVLAAGFCYTASRGNGIVKEGASLAEESFINTKPTDGTDPSFQKTEPEESAPGQESADPVSDLPEQEVSACYVHICGEVVFPGVYELKEGSRVFQAVEKAGGFTDQAAAESLNMAERVDDGMKIVVLNKEEAEEAKARGEISLAGEAVSKSSKVNLNTAVKEELMTLKGIGQSRAEDIIRFRESRGGFQKIEDVMKVSGIKDAAFQKIKDDIMVK